GRARQRRDRPDRRRGRRRRTLGLDFAGSTSRRGGGVCDSVAGVIDTGEIRVHAGPGVQRVLSPPADSPRRTRRCAPLEGRGGRLCQAPAGDGPQPDWWFSACAYVTGTAPFTIYDPLT